MAEASARSEIIEETLSELRRGENREANFRKLFESYYRPVHRFFERRGFSVEESHDLTQDTFLRVFQNIETFRGEAPFEAWLFQIAANIRRNALRHSSAAKRAGHTLTLADEAEEGEALTACDPQPDSLEVMLQDETARALREAVESLPDQMRRCVMLRAYQDLSYKEIATLMKLSVETVKAHLHQARARLREQLSAHRRRVGDD